MDMMFCFFQFIVLSNVNTEQKKTAADIENHVMCTTRSTCVQYVRCDVPHRTYRDKVMYICILYTARGHGKSKRHTWDRYMYDVRCTGLSEADTEWCGGTAVAPKHLDTGSHGWQPTRRVELWVDGVWVRVSLKIPQWAPIHIRRRVRDRCTCCWARRAWQMVGSVWLCNSCVHVHILYS